MKTETLYEKLPDEVFPKGTGIPDLSARLLKRYKNLCLYERSDENYEVFIVKTQEATEMFGKNYPAKEVYPNNEDFGYSAWCYHDKKEAEKKFQRLIDWRKV